MTNKIFALSLIIALLPIILFLSIIIKLESKGKIIFWSKRVGYKNKLFCMPKFRSMYETTPSRSSKLLNKPEIHITRVGRYMRKLSLDEIPQLYSILIGDMAFVGPRPLLDIKDEKELLDCRLKYGITELIPGITGWAQINGRDNINIESKIELDCYYLKNKSFLFDCYIILVTIIRVFSGKNITH